ncbi:Uncharacterised protein [Pseudomonas fluorescens]|uniref:Uncharacterized protein n=1 Tax=Pseudomonas fluorescens TaxID=294 RepID=A0A3S4R2G3_PSEFL|nr:Uncharacterised protein [Pseudomonas fluorescens]
MARFHTAWPVLGKGYFSRTTFPAAMHGMPHGTALADYKKGVRLWLSAMAKG